MKCIQWNDTASSQSNMAWRCRDVDWEKRRFLTSALQWNMQVLTFGEAIFRLHQLLSKLRDLLQQFCRICQIHCAAFGKTDFIKLVVNKSKDEENKLINRPEGSSWVFIPLTDIPPKATTTDIAMHVTRCPLLEWQLCLRCGELTVDPSTRTTTKS